MQDVGKLLFLAGLTLAAIGAVLYAGARFLKLGRLPGDWVYHRDGFTFYFPLGTSIALSIGLTILLSFVLWMLRRKP